MAQLLLWARSDVWPLSTVSSATVRLADARLRRQIDVNGHKLTLSLFGVAQVPRIHDLGTIIIVACIKRPPAHGLVEMSRRTPDLSCETHTFGALIQIFEEYVRPTGGSKGHRGRIGQLILSDG